MLETVLEMERLWLAASMCTDHTRNLTRCSCNSNLASIAQDLSIEKVGKIYCNQNKVSTDTRTDNRNTVKQNALTVRTAEQKKGMAITTKNVKTHG